MSTTAMASGPKYTNRLARETSPYLLQHAHNPVDWYPWGPEAFDAAREQKKPIFVSIGYSTCYWCHVMERQCFENETIAREMNRAFINIKVDREERPDVDLLYMTAVQVLNRQGGWPLSVFLTPDLRPFYGGTYFPPTDAPGRPGFLTVLRAIDDTYRMRLGDVEKTCAQLMDILQQLAEPQRPETPITINDAFIGELVDRSTSDYDAKLGGFGPAPKFPRQTLLSMLLAYIRYCPGVPDPDSRVQERRSRLLEMLRRTLDGMADGGIHDHLGGGFHRYSTDDQWLVPHFEIMLYDNAMLGRVYAEASRLMGVDRYAKVARGIFNFVLREMTSPEGAFYTAFDAEVDAMEGASYLWTPQEVDSLLLDQDARLFRRIYGIDRGPNFADPHHGIGQPDKSILYLPEPLDRVAMDLGMNVEDLDRRLEPMRQKLFAARRQRKQPLLDTKIITSWNALMIGALAYGGRVLSEPGYIAAAGRAADYLLARHAMPGGGLWRSSRDGAARVAGFLDDYAFMAHALLELQEAGQPFRRDQAAGLAGQMARRFVDEEDRGFYFTDKDAREIIIRQKIGSDSPLPSGNAIAAMVLLELDDDDEARDTIGVFARHLEATPDSTSAMIEAAIQYVRCNGAFAVSPGPWRGESNRPISPAAAAAAAVSVEASWLSPAELLIRLAIAAPFHINAHDAARDLIATTLTVAADRAADVEAIDYPPGEERRFAFSDQPLRIYEGVVTLAVRFKRSMQGQPPLHLALSYQPCTEDACLSPVTRDVEVNAP